MLHFEHTLLVRADLCALVVAMHSRAWGTRLCTGEWVKNLDIEKCPVLRAPETFHSDVQTNVVIGDRRCQPYLLIRR